MILYLLERSRISAAGYDEAMGFVVAASNPDEARELASKQAGDEGAAAWLAPSLTTCREIGSGETQTSGVILRSFNAG